MNREHRLDAWKPANLVFEPNQFDIDDIKKMKGRPMTKGQISDSAQAKAACMANNIIDRLINAAQAEN